MKITEIDALTGEVIEREPTTEELTQFAIDEELALQEQVKLEEKQTERAALLERLGITSQEATLLLG